MTHEWVLILAMWAGTFSKYDSSALTSIGGFVNQTLCEDAGKEAVKKFTTTFKTVEYVCAKR